MEEDVDSDNMADDWEVIYFGNTNRDGTADLDNDGQSDLNEFKAGTDPGDPSSLLAITSVWANVSDVIISWYSASNKSYALTSTTNLAAGFADFTNSLPATPPINAFTVTSDGVKSRFYRVRVE